MIHSIRAVGSDKAVASVTFTSTQAASQGPNGDTRDNWKLDFTMKRMGPMGLEWLIDNVSSPDVSTLMPSTSPVPAASASTASSIIPWNQALDYVGDYETVEGPVAGTDYARSSNDSPTFLNVGYDYPNQRRFIVVIWGENRDSFPQPPEDMYSSGTTIRVTGLVTNYRGCAEIAVSSPDDIEGVP